MEDFVFDGNLSEIDPEIHQLIQYEAERQQYKLILIASESPTHPAIRESLGSVFQNLYAEGYPDEDTRWMTEEQILDYTSRLNYYRRYSDPRYYKGVEYADTVEALARRRCAELFATDTFSPDHLFVNVQPLSGAPANNAVYSAMIKPGDSIMGMNLLHGGHLSHGSPVNRSGKLYNVNQYTVDPVTQKIDYAQVEALAKEYRPKIIITGYSSYPWVPDWEKFRQIADSVGAYLLADMSHIAGLVAGKTIPSPIGIAHVTTFTTHKTLFGPRGAVIITTNPEISKKIDRAVFPGEQGGPHVQVFAALATTFKLAATEKFSLLQKKIIQNAQVLCDQLIKRGFRIPYGGTNTHLLNLDCKSVSGTDGTLLSGDMAARILDIVGLVINRNTIPGDSSAKFASGIRIATPWITKRGLNEQDMIEIGDILADTLFATTPYKVISRDGYDYRAKINFKVLEEAKLRVRALAEKSKLDTTCDCHGYPHFYYLDDKSEGVNKYAALELTSPNIKHFISYVFNSAAEDLPINQSQTSQLVTSEKRISGILTHTKENAYRFTFPNQDYGLTATWLRALSDGYIKFDGDLLKRIPGPVAVVDAEPVPSSENIPVSTGIKKPYYIGMDQTPDMDKAKQEFSYTGSDSAEVQRTVLYKYHKESGAKIIPFAGWDMPVWYHSVIEEHKAARNSAGLFDVTHMGVFQAEGADAALFLDSVCANDISLLAVGESCYTHFLDPQANVIDDLLVYRRSDQTYLMVVNASNEDKDWKWLTGVRDGIWLVDNDRPWVDSFGKNVTLRNLKNPAEGADMRVDIALQGPRSRDILLALGCDTELDRTKLMKLQRTELCEAKIGGYDLVVSRTGYTGEPMSFELFVHPDKAMQFWNDLLAAGKPFGIAPCGLGARDSLRTEAGLPLYGHEMGGDHNLGVSDAGFQHYVKTYKPWFIGRNAYMNKEAKRTGEVVRFRHTEKGVRMAHHGDPVLDKRGKVIGFVTSCAIDSDELLTGQAYIDKKFMEENTPIFILHHTVTVPVKPASDLETGDRYQLPAPAVVVSRFPKLTKPK